jgi:hypothetical protein
MKPRLLLLAAALFLVCAFAGCVIPPSQTAINAAVTDAPPDRAYAEAEIRAFVETLLIDPTAPIYRFSAPVKAYSSKITPGKVTYGWSVPFSLNSKNRMGGYTGASAGEGFFVGGKLMGVYQTNHKGGYGWFPAR